MKFAAFSILTFFGASGSLIDGSNVFLLWPSSFRSWKLCVCTGVRHTGSQYINCFCHGIVVSIDHRRGRILNGPRPKGGIGIMLEWLLVIVRNKLWILQSWTYRHRCYVYKEPLDEVLSILQCEKTPVSVMLGSNREISRPWVKSFPLATSILYVLAASCIICPLRESTENLIQPSLTWLETCDNSMLDSTSRPKNDKASQRTFTCYLILPLDHASCELQEPTPSAALDFSLQDHIRLFAPQEEQGSKHADQGGRFEKKPLGWERGERETPAWNSWVVFCRLLDRCSRFVHEISFKYKLSWQMWHEFLINWQVPFNI